MSCHQMEEDVYCDLTKKLANAIHWTT